MDELKEWLKENMFDEEDFDNNWTIESERSIIDEKESVTGLVNYIYSVTGQSAEKTLSILTKALEDIHEDTDS